MIHIKGDVTLTGEILQKFVQRYDLGELFDSSLPSCQFPVPLSSFQLDRISTRCEIARTRLLSRRPKCCKRCSSGQCTHLCARANPLIPCTNRYLSRSRSCLNTVVQQSGHPFQQLPTNSDNMENSILALSTKLSAEYRRVHTIRHIPIDCP